MSNAREGTWLSQVENARSVRDLIGVLRDYLGSMTPEMLAELPRGCTAENVTTVEEIQEWAVTLAQADLKANGDGVLHQAAAVFTAAGAKVPRLGD